MQHSTLQNTAPEQGTAQPVRAPQKVRPFSFAWGVIFLAIGLSGLMSSGLGIAAGSTLSMVVVIAGFLAVYLITRQRRLVNAAHAAAVSAMREAPFAPHPTPTSNAQPPATPSRYDDPLYREALAELDSVDHTMISNDDFE